MELLDFISKNISNSEYIDDIYEIITEVLIDNKEKDFLKNETFGSQKNMDYLKKNFSGIYLNDVQKIMNNLPYFTPEIFIDLQCISEKYRFFNEENYNLSYAFFNYFEEILKKQDYKSAYIGLHPMEYLEKYYENMGFINSGISGFMISPNLIEEHLNLKNFEDVVE